MSEVNNIPEGWVETALGEVVEIKYGKDHKHLNTGNIACFGSGGLMRKVNEVLYNKPSVLIPRKGTLSNLFYINEPFWTVDTLFYTKINEQKISPKYLFFKLKTFNLENMNVGSAVPSLTTNVLNQLVLEIPKDVTEQKSIAAILTSFDDKIELLQAQNKTLEETAQTIFKEWFGKYQIGDELPEGWRVGAIGDILEIKRGGSPRPIQDYLSDNGYRWLKISDATATACPFIFNIKEHIKPEGLKNTVLKKAGDIVLSNSATPGMPKILAVDSCVHDGWMHFPCSKVSNEYLYLLFISIRPNLVQQGSGSVFTNLKTDILREYAIVIPPENVFIDFDKLIKPLFDKILINASQIQSLTQTRDELLPKLMSGEIRVNEFDK